MSRSRQHSNANANYNLHDKIAIEEAAQMIRSKVHLYRAMSMKGFHLPNIKSPMVSVDYLLKVSVITVTVV
jgi:hypothetical protein